MIDRNTPVWTGVVIGLLLGLLAGTVWLFLRERAANAGPEIMAAAGPGTRAQPAGYDSDDGGGGGTSGGSSAEPIGSGRRTAIVKATEMVAPAVVSINVIEHRTYVRSTAPPGFELLERMYPGLFPRREFRQNIQSLGSGVIVSEDGYVLTNHHVVEDADEVIVTLSDGRQSAGQIVDVVPQYDLALVKIEGENLPVAAMAAGNRLYIGEWAIAIGSPFGYLLADTQPTVTIGVISALNRDIKRTDRSRTYLGMIQTDAAINPGNSGGPLVNANGEVIGINTFIFSESGGSVGIGFAVPIERAQWLINEVREHGRFRQAYSGLKFQKLTPNLVRAFNLDNPVGFIVLEVSEDSPAWKAGLRVGDIIRKINGVPLDTRDTVTRLIYEAKVGTQLEFEAERDGEFFGGAIVLEEAQG